MKNSVLLEFEGSYVKVIYVKIIRSSLSLLAVGTFEFNPQEPKSAQLKQFFKELEIHPTEAIVLVSRLQATTKVIDLPATQADEIKKMLPFQVTQLVPYAKEEIILDYTVLEQTKTAKLFLVLLQKKIFDTTLQLVREAGLDLVSLRFNTQEALPFYSETYSLETPTLLIDFDFLSVHFSVINQNKLFMARTLPLSALLSEEAAPLLLEINNTLSAGQKELEQPITQIILHGIPKTAQTLIAPKLETLKIKTLFTPKKDPFLDKNLQRSQFKIPADSFSFSALLGALKNMDAPKINLIPESMVQQSRQQSKQKRVTFAALFLLGFILCSSLVLFFKNYQLDQKLRQLKAQSSQTQKGVTSLMNQLDKIKLIQSRKQDLLLDVLAEIYRITPNTIAIDSIAYNADEGFFLKGTALSLSDIVNLIPKFDASPFFEKVTTKGTTTKKIKNRVYTDFQLELHFPGKTE